MHYSKAFTTNKKREQLFVPFNDTPQREHLAHTSVQINSLIGENRMINTKLQVLENELREKDKLFEDMYRVAFNANQGCKPGAATSGADNSMQLAPQVFFPS